MASMGYYVWNGHEWCKVVGAVVLGLLLAQEVVMYIRQGCTLGSMLYLSSLHDLHESLQGLYERRQWRLCSVWHRWTPPPRHLRGRRRRRLSEGALG